MEWFKGLGLLARVGLSLHVTSLGLGAWAQAAATPPDAGALQQQIGRELNSPRRAPTPGQGLEDVRAPAAAEGSQMVLVRSFVLEGNQLLATPALEPLLQRHLERSLSYADLQQVLRDIEAAYAEAGWVARASLPQQDVTEGRIRIQLREATLGNLVFNSAADARINEERVRRLFAQAQVPGEALRLKALNRALLLARDLPGVSVSGGLSEWPEQGGVRDLVLDVGALALIAGEAQADNSGSRSTGASRLIASASLNSALGVGDLTRISAMKSAGVDYWRLDASLPVGADGWRVGLYDEHLRYRATGEFAALSLRGGSNSYGFTASYPLLRSTGSNLYVNAQFERKHYDNQDNTASDNRYHSAVANVGLLAQVPDSWRGFSIATLNLIAGRLDLSGATTGAADAVGPRTAGGFTKLRYSFQRQQALGRTWSAYLALSGQWAQKNLDSSEKFALGGDAGVRAYPVGEATGALGQLLSLELRRPLAQMGVLSAFYDWGQTQAYRYPDFSGAPPNNRYQLRGAGLAWNWAYQDRLRLKLVWARRIGHNPNSTATGADQDGSQIKDRIWLSTSYSF